MILQCYKKAATNLFNSLTRGFCNLQNSCMKLKSVLDEELSREQQQTQSKKTQEQKKQYFESKGWKVNQNNIQVQLSKQIYPYRVNVLFNAKAPPLVQEKQPNRQVDQSILQQEQLNTEESYISQVAVCIKNRGSDNWLVADYIISNFGSDIFNIKFTADIDSQKRNKRVKNFPLNGQFRGATMQSLQQKTKQLIYLFIQSLGIDKQFLENTSEYSFAYEQKFYIEWLKDLRSMT